MDMEIRVLVTELLIGKMRQIKVMSSEPDNNPVGWALPTSRKDRTNHIRIKTQRL